MKKFTDYNFLNGKLTIISKPENNITIGRLCVYDEYSDSIINFNAYSSCNPNDTFDINTGIKITKLKLAKQYYKHNKQILKKIMSHNLHTYNSLQNKLNKTTKKLNNINFELNKF